MDNASTDDSMDDLNPCPHHIIRNTKNRLYAKAANQGIEYALKEGAEKILLLNFDLTLTNDFLEKLVKSKAQIAGPTIYYKKAWSRDGKLDIYEGVIEQ